MQLKNWLIMAGLVLAGPALAVQPANVEYSADSSMETADDAMIGTIYVAPGKERRESVNDGEKSVMIIRRDKKVTWMLQPEEKTYMEMKSGQGGARKDDISAYKIDHTTIGPDTVNGIKTTKSKLIMIGPKGDKLGGFMWTTKEGIVVKMDAIAVDKNSKERFKSELKNLKVGRQDPSLFEIPADYTKMDMSMGGLGNMMTGGDGKEDKKQPQEEGKKKGFGWKDAVDLLK
jgi:hypothetical protein